MPVWGFKIFFNAKEGGVHYKDYFPLHVDVTLTCDHHNSNTLFGISLNFQHQPRHLKGKHKKYHYYFNGR